MTEIIYLKVSYNTNYYVIVIVQPQPASKPHTAIHSLIPSGGSGRESEVWEWENSWVEIKAVKRAKQNPHMQARKTRKWFTILQGQPSPGKEGSITAISVLGRQAQLLWLSPPSSLLPQLYMLSMVPCAMGHPLGQSVGVSCPGCVTSQLLEHPQLPTGWSGVKG